MQERPSNRVYLALPVRSAPALYGKRFGNIHPVVYDNALAWTLSQLQENVDEATGTACMNIVVTDNQAFCYLHGSLYTPAATLTGKTRYALPL